MLKGFKEFILRGNVVDLAVAVVIGTAFTGLVTAVTKSLIQPLVNLFLGGGAKGGTVEVNGQVFDFGSVINAIIDFIIVAAVLYFFVVLPMNKYKEFQAKRAGSPTEAEESDLDVLKDIREALRTSDTGQPVRDKSTDPFA